MKSCLLRCFGLLYLLAGFALLAYILMHTDLHEVWSRVGQMGPGGVIFVLLLYALTFLTDVIGWQLTFRSLPLERRWCGRLYLVRMLGEAFNNVTPLGSMGGEPVKVAVLKRHYRIPMREAGASLVLAKTTNMLGLMMFLLVGFVLLLLSRKLAPGYQLLAAAGLAGLLLATLAMFLVQRFRLSSRAGGWLLRGRVSERLHHLLRVIEDIDARLLEFYTRNQGRFLISTALALSNWLLGVVEVYVVMRLFGYPVTVTDAWIIEAMVQMIRAAAFFIPAGIGAQEGGFLLFSGALTGNPALGIAVSVVRRSRELLWILLGLLIFWGYQRRRKASTGDGIQQ